MSFWHDFINLGHTVTDAAARTQRENAAKRGGGGSGGGRAGKPECTPCAAQAYVDALRPKPQR